MQFPKKLHCGTGAPDNTVPGVHAVLRRKCYCSPQSEHHSLCGADDKSLASTRTPERTLHHQSSVPGRLRGTQSPVLMRQVDDNDFLVGQCEGLVRARCICVSRLL
jgi:hypothetical protein